MLNYENLVEKLIEKMPELQQKYEEEMVWLEEELPHMVFMLVLNPYLIELLTSELKECDAQLKTVFAFLEKMAINDNEKVLEVLVATVLEELITEREIIVKAREYMGPATLKHCLEQEKFFGFELKE